jgi:CheY-like chemotaxis protein
MRTLIVDDNPVNLMIIAQILENLGHEVLQAESGEGAIQVLNRSRWAVDLILTDLEMSPGDGWYLIRKVRDQAERRPSVMILSASDGEQEMARAANEGVPFLRKPFSLESLTLALNQIFRQAA